MAGRMRLRWLRRRPPAEVLSDLRWLQFCQGQGLVFYTVHRVYQRAHRGSKAVATAPDGRYVDVWFWWCHVPASSIVAAVPAHVEFGPHTNRPGVHYVGSPHESGVEGWLSVDRHRAVMRYMERMWKAFQLERERMIPLASKDEMGPLGG